MIPTRGTLLAVAREQFSMFTITEVSNYFFLIFVCHLLTSLRKPMLKLKKSFQERYPHVSSESAETIKLTKFDLLTLLFETYVNVRAMNQIKFLLILFY